MNCSDEACPLYLVYGHLQILLKQIRPEIREETWEFLKTGLAVDTSLVESSMRSRKKNQRQTLRCR